MTPCSSSILYTFHIFIYDLFILAALTIYFKFNVYTEHLNHIRTYTYTVIHGPKLGLYIYRIAAFPAMQYTHTVLPV